MALRDAISRLRHFLVELKRRKVYQIGAVYAAVAFVIWQAAEVAFPAVGLPNAAVTFVVVVSVLGFPIALVLAWALEVSPDGVAVTREAGDEREPGEPATAPPAAGQRQVNELAERDFLITEEICRKLDRRTLDPQMIGDRLQYVDNQVESDVLVAYLHGLGLDGYAFSEILETLPYRAVAPTLYGFERTTHRRVPLSLADHVVLIREFLRGTIQRQRPSTTVLVGFSVGAWGSGSSRRRETRRPCPWMATWPSAPTSAWTPASPRRWWPGFPATTRRACWPTWPRWDAGPTPWTSG